MIIGFGCSLIATAGPRRNTLTISRIHGACRVPEALAQGQALRAERLRSVRKQGRPGRPACARADCTPPGLHIARGNCKRISRPIFFSWQMEARASRVRGDCVEPLTRAGRTRERGGSLRILVAGKPVSPSAKARATGCHPQDPARGHRDAPRGLGVDRRRARRPHRRLAVGHRPPGDADADGPPDADPLRPRHGVRVEGSRAARCDGGNRQASRAGGARPTRRQSSAPCRGLPVPRHRRRISAALPWTSGFPRVFAPPPRRAIRARPGCRFCPRFR